MKIRTDFSKAIGAIKPMHGVGQPPFTGGDFSMFHYLEEAGIPYSRLHDVGGPFGGNLYADIPNLFRDFDADPYDPASYDFVFTDRLIEQLMEVHCEPFFRLGVTIENSQALKAYRVFPPKDPAKWAVICEHVIRHYNEGWANGYHYNIRYWEIWNEPDDCYTVETSYMWRGTPAQFYELYDVASKHLKQCFGDSISVGGYASIGFGAYRNYPDLGDIGRKCTCFEEFFFEFLDGFLRYIKEHGSPLDFFSWHTYADVKIALRHAEVCREILNRYGFADTPDILNEWNPNPVEIKLRKSNIPAAKVLAIMLGMQHRSPSVLCYYDARIGPSVYGGLFNPDSWEPYPAYYSFRTFNEAYRLGNEVACEGDDPDVFVLAARRNGEAVLLIANIGEQKECRLEFVGADAQITLLRTTDADRTYAEAEPPRDDVLSLPPFSCHEIHLKLT